MQNTNNGFWVDFDNLFELLDGLFANAEFSKPNPPTETRSDRMPKSIFELMDDGTEFRDICTGYHFPRGLDGEYDEEGDPSSYGPGEEPWETGHFGDECERQDPPSRPVQKNPFVFIANRLTFLVQTSQPIVFNTASIEAEEGVMTIAVNVSKTFPKPTFQSIARMCSEVNSDPEIQKEIADYLEGTGISGIFASPDKMGDGCLAMSFVLISR